MSGEVPSRGTERYSSFAQADSLDSSLADVDRRRAGLGVHGDAGQKSGRFVYITLHKSIGQTIFFLALFRLVWRRSIRPRLCVPGLLLGRYYRAGELLAAYVVMVLMPVTGYVLATAAARPSPYFWLFYWPQLAVSAVVAHAALRAHLVGQYFVYTMVGLHLAAVISCRRPTRWDS